MNKKGSLELQTEMIIRLILVLAILGVVVFIVYTIISLFINADIEYTAKKNFVLVEDRVALMTKSGDTSTDTILQLPPNYYIVSFDAGSSQGQITVTAARNPGARVSQININRPTTCGVDSCLCLLHTQAGASSDYSDKFEALKCDKTKIPYRTTFKQLSPGSNNPSPFAVTIEKIGNYWTIHDGPEPTVKTS